MKKRLLYLYLALLFALLAVGYAAFNVALAYKNRNDGFTVEKTVSVVPNDPQWEIVTSKNSLIRANAILNQPWYYLGSGFQCYAFISQDGQYVLKFLRHQRLRPPSFFDALLLKTEKKTTTRQDRVQGLFQSLKVAIEDIPDETGILFVHLNKTAGHHRPVTIHNKCGEEFQISLDDREFILQRKAELIKPVFSKLMEEGRVEQAKARIDQIFALMTISAKKGVKDLDRALIKKNNLGFLEDRAIYIDAGKLVKVQGVSGLEFAADLTRLRALRKWLMQHYPDLANYFDKAQKKVIDSFE